MTSCSWCHTLNADDALACRKCSHDAQVARAVCGCYQCTCFPTLKAFAMRGMRAQKAVDKIIEAAKA